MAPKSDNVQRLLDAEAERNRIVATAKAQKAEKIKQAKVDAENTVADFRKAKEQEFNQFKSEQLGSATNDNNKYVAGTDKAISDMKRLAAARMDKVAQLIVDLVTTVPQ